MIQNKSLYSLDKNGNPISWTIKWDTESNWYTMSSGRVDGAIVETKPTYCIGKNKGRNNETSNISQCQLEVYAKISKQYKKDFHDSIPTRKHFEVTLAKEFSARKKFIRFPMLASAKLDGFRCYITKDGMFSRTHHKIISCPHIFAELEKYFKVDEGIIFDGELYSHELKDDFNKIASLLSRTKNLDNEFLNVTKNIIKFNVFDIFNKHQPLPYNERCKVFLDDSEDLIKFISPFNSYKSIVKVNQFIVNSFEDVEKYINLAITEGFEGIMLRNPRMPYDEGRSSNLIKYKKFKDSEYKVIDIKDGIGNFKDQASIITCEDKNGTQFSVGMGKGWNEELKKELFRNREQYIGKIATIVYQDLTPDEHVPRFGKLKAFRDKNI